MFSEAGDVARIEVKAKQGRDWPNCKGISGSNAFLVFVDYQNREDDQRPDFYVLTSKDWRRVLEVRVAEERAKNPRRRIRITDNNVDVFEDQIGRDGRAYQGMGIRPADLPDFHDRWEKMTDSLNAS